MISTADLEQLHRAAERLRAAREQAALNRAVVHDINNALTLVVMLGEAVCDDDDDGDDMRVELAIDVRCALSRANQLLGKLTLAAA